jgi:type IV pilus assembly protein PilW
MNHPKTSSSQRRHRAQQGFMLIEVLCALLIFSAGILAMVGLQATSVQQASAARFRVVAAMLANDLISRMWASDRTAATLQASFASTSSTQQHQHRLRELVRRGAEFRSPAGGEPAAHGHVHNGRRRRQLGRLQQPGDDHDLLAGSRRHERAQVRRDGAGEVMEPVFRLPRMSRRAGRGFSLIEIMVGLVIGMFSILIVMRIFAASEANKRTTTGGNDAQVNGSVALYGLERDIRQAGYGISAYSILGCSLTYTTTGDAASVTLAALAPVTINPAASLVPAGDANTDTLLVIGGNSASPSEGDATTAATTATAYAITTPTAFTVGDRVIAAATTRSTPCALALATVKSISGSTLTVASGTAGLATGDPVYNLGPTPIARAYAVRNGNLTVCDYTAYNCGSTSYTSTLNSDVWVPVASNVVSLRAQYGRDTTGISGSTSTMTGVLDTYDQTTPGSSADSTTIPLYCGWSRVIALRLAIVARSPSYDKTLPTSAAPSWDGSTANTAATSTLSTVTPTAAAIDLSSNANWKYYRYRTVQTTVPLRNTIWQGSQSTYQGGAGGC